MGRSDWAIRAKALAATSLLACGMASVGSAAKADYSYTFSLTPLSGTIVGASGNFTTDQIVTATNFSTVTSGNYSYTYNGISFSGSFANQSGSFRAGTISIAGFGLNPSNSFSSSGSITAASGTGFSGSTVSASEAATPTSGAFSLAGTGLLQAFLSVSSGGGGGGGSSGGGGGGGSGGVPSPEVNAGLGLLLAGTTFAFLRRRRGAPRDSLTA